MNAGKRIAELRMLHGMSQDELAGRLFVDRSLVSKWESGVRRPDRNNVEKMAALFGVSPGYILEKDEQIMRELASCIPEGADIGPSDLPSLLDSFLDLLGEHERTVLVLRYHLLEQPAQIAERCGSSSAAVSATLWRLRRKLRQYLLRVSNSTEVKKK